MKMHYDEKSDALYLRLDESKIIESGEVQPGIVLDYNDNKQVVGVEILRVVWIGLIWPTFIIG